MSTWPHPVTAITGASSGLGRELAIEIARRGGDLALLARGKDGLEEAAAAVRGEGRRAVVVPCDVRDREGVLAAFREVESTLGPVDLLIANAGVGTPVPASKWDGRRVAEVLEVNILGPVYAIEAVLPGMLARRRGRIVGISSLSAWRAFPFHGPYGASKAALNYVLESLRLDLMPSGVGVTTICPGFIRTPMTEPNRFKMPFLLEPDDAARRIVDAIAAGRRLYAFPWPMALAVRFARLLPELAWERIAGKKRR